MGSDHQSWNQEPSRHDLPHKVKEKFRRDEERHDLWMLAIKVAMILAAAGAFVWWLTRH